MGAGRFGAIGAQQANARVVFNRTATWSQLGGRVALQVGGRPGLVAGVWGVENVPVLHLSWSGRGDRQGRCPKATHRQTHQSPLGPALQSGPVLPLRFGRAEPEAQTIREGRAARVWRLDEFMSAIGAKTHITPRNWFCGFGVFILPNERLPCWVIHPQSSSPKKIHRPFFPTHKLLEGWKWWKSATQSPGG